ncbi:MAG: glutaredoxin family protein [Deltaproteobacteria bacterium]|nr:glutaredoxin family protein [Deltaproteobacteria bacterium]
MRRGAAGAPRPLSRTAAPIAAGLLALALMARPAGAGDDPLKPLQAALEAKNAEEVLLRSLDLDPLPATAADPLAAAARLANEGGDALLGMQLCQRALKVAPRHRESLLACIASARSLDQFDPALEWMRQLREAHPGDSEGQLWELRLLAAEGEWEACAEAGRAFARSDAPAAPKAEAKTLTGRCELRLEENAAARTEVATLMAALAKARAEAPRSTPVAAGAGERRPAAGGEGVIVYSTRWCGYCKKAKRWLKQQGVAFVEKDIERDPEATIALAKKAAEQRMRLGGVPVFEVNGELMGGWSEKGLRRLLERHGYLR